MLEDALGRQALHHASQAGASVATQLLITEGASVNAKATETGLTALHYAAKVRVGQPHSQSLHVCTIIALSHRAIIIVLAWVGSLCSYMYPV